MRTLYGTILAACVASFCAAAQAASVADGNVVDPAEYGFSPDSAPDVNRQALQRALDGGRRTVKTAKGGVYGLDGTVFIDSDTVLEFAPGTVLKKMKPYANVLVNRGAFNYGCDSNIVVRNVEISVNGMQGFNDENSNAPGLRGNFAFYRVKNVECRNFSCFDLESSQYCWQAVDFDGLILDGFTIRGKKDGVHINCGKNFAIRNGILRTGDDGIALNAGDWPGGCTPKMGSIENGIIENIVDEAGGKCNFIRVIPGSGKEWHPGMKLQRNDIFTVGRNVYCVWPMPVSSKEYVSLTAPTHAHGAWKSPEGINFLFLQDNGETRADIRNVTVRNVRMECVRAITCHWEICDWARLVHPEVPNVGYPAIDLRIENLVKTASGPVVYGDASCRVTFRNVRAERGQLIAMNRHSKGVRGTPLYASDVHVKAVDCAAAGGGADIFLDDPDGTGSVEISGWKGLRAARLGGRAMPRIAVSGDAKAETTDALLDVAGPVTDKTPGWRFEASNAKDGKAFNPTEGWYPDKGGKLVSPRVSIPDAGAYYKLSFTASAPARAYEAVEFYNINADLVADNYDVIYPGGTNRYERIVFAHHKVHGAVGGVRVVFQSKAGCSVSDVRLEPATADEAAAWCDKVYAKLPPVETVGGQGLPPRTLDALKTGKPWRILMLGDSIMQDTFHSQFHALVKRAYPKSDITWLLSVRGSTGCWYYRIPENFAKCVAAYKPDCVIVGGISNWKTASDDYPVQGNAAIFEVGEKIRAMGAELIVVTPTLSVDTRRPKETPAMTPVPRMAFDAVKTANALARTTGGPSLSVADLKALKDGCAERGWGFVDAFTPAYRWLCESGLPYQFYSRDDVHSGELGKQIIGRIMLEYFINAL